MPGRKWEEKRGEIVKILYRRGIFTKLKFGDEVSKDKWEEHSRKGKKNRGINNVYYNHLWLIDAYSQEKRGNILWIVFLFFFNACLVEIKKISCEQHVDERTLRSVLNRFASPNRKRIFTVPNLSVSSPILLFFFFVPFKGICILGWWRTFSHTKLCARSS